MTSVSPKPGVRDAGTNSGTRLNLLAWLLRAEGLLDLTAACVVLAPVENIQAFNQFLGLEPIPSHPLTWYLIRATSAIYAACGALLIFLSLDVVRYRPAIRFLGLVAATYGTAIIFVDRSAGLPEWWRLTEGPTLIVISLVVIWLARPEN